jgi:TolA-binding protein
MRPDSSRVPEAIYQIGWTLRQEDKIEEAREVYWRAIKEMGDDPSKIAVEDLLLGLLRLSKADEEKAALREELRHLSEVAKSEERKTLQARLAWALAQTYKKGDPQRYSFLLDEVGRMIEPSKANPSILWDVASSYRADGRNDKAEALLKDLVKWNPRAPQKGEALSTLGMIAKEQKRDVDALKLFARFQREASGSMAAASVFAAKAEIELAQGHQDAALQTLEELLKAQGASGRDKANALYQIGEIYAARGEAKKAFAYFQRIYVLYSRFNDLVAKSYVRCGAILEDLKDKDGAIKTYEEFLEREELQGTDEMRVARERLEKLNA